MTFSVRFWRRDTHFSVHWNFKSHISWGQSSCRWVLTSKKMFMMQREEEEKLEHASRWFWTFMSSSTSSSPSYHVVRHSHSATWNIFLTLTLLFFVSCHFQYHQLIYINTNERCGIDSMFHYTKKEFFHFATLSTSYWSTRRPFFKFINTKFPINLLLVKFFLVPTRAYLVEALAGRKKRFSDKKLSTFFLL